MLEITVDAREGFDDRTQEFINIKKTTLQLEHSLISISKWESKWHKPFLQHSRDLTTEEIIDYIKCMTVSPGNIDNYVYYFLSEEDVKKIIDYIQNPMTATWIGDKDTKRAPSKDIITSELIYYWMVALQIPFECQKWHLNRLLMLIRVCNEKNQEANPKYNKLGKRELMSRNAALNAQRRAKLHSKG